MNKVLFIVGGKSTAIEILEVVQQYYKEKYFKIINIIGDGEDNLNVENYIFDKDLSNTILNFSQNSELEFIIGLTNINLKTKFISLLNEKNTKAINIIHPSAYISPSAKIGLGNYIAANTVISSNAKVGDHNIVNYNVTIGHDAVIHSNCLINPGSRISGNVEICCGVLVGSNSFVYQGKKIGENVLIDAMTYIDKDIPNNSICSSKQLKVYKRIN